MRIEDLQSYCLDLLQTARHWRRLADRLVRPFGLTEATALPLLLIARRGGMRQTVLADAVGIEGPSLVRALDQLCAAGLVVRQEDQADRRAKCLYLTQEGRVLSERMARDLDALRVSVFGNVDVEDLAASRRVFDHIAAMSESATPQSPTPLREAAS